MLLLLLLLLSCLSHVRLYATPQMAAHLAPTFLGFSRQEYWSGLPFPSPMHPLLIATGEAIPLRPRPWDSPGKNTGVGCHFLLQCIPT